MTADFDLLVIGDINADLILTGEDPAPVFGEVEKVVDDGVLTVGGSSAIVACGAARLGLRTACIGVLGDDALGAFLRTALRERGVDVSSVRADTSRHTGVTIVLARRDTTDRAILSALGTAATLTVEQIDPVMVGRSCHLHCGAFFLQPSLQAGLARMFADARRQGLTCSLDTNWDPTGSWDGGLKDVLRHCSLFFPNEAEARAISGCDNVSEAAAKLASAGPTVAVKLGAKGALVRKGDRTLCAMAPATKLIDTTGAGDAFDAGYLFGFLNGWETERCLTLGIACGSLSTRRAGGVEGQPDIGEAQRLAKTIEVREA